MFQLYLSESDYNFFFVNFSCNSFYLLNKYVHRIQNYSVEWHLCWLQFSLQFPRRLARSPFTSFLFQNEIFLVFFWFFLVYLLECIFFDYLMLDRFQSDIFQLSVKPVQESQSSVHISCRHFQPVICILDFFLLLTNTLLAFNGSSSWFIILTNISILINMQIKSDPLKLVYLMHAFHIMWQLKQILD